MVATEAILKLATDERFVGRCVGTAIRNVPALREDCYDDLVQSAIEFLLARYHHQNIDSAKGTLRNHAAVSILNFLRRKVDREIKHRNRYRATAKIEAKDHPTIDPRCSSNKREQTERLMETVRAARRDPNPHVISLSVAAEILLRGGSEERARSIIGRMRPDALRKFRRYYRRPS